MNSSWSCDNQPDPTPIGPLGWARIALRGTALVVLVFGGLGLLLAVRLIERPIWGLHRPWTPRITQTVCRLSLIVLGIGFSTRGTQMPHKGAVVANHTSWLDIFVLNARKRVYFVSKSEVAGWPGIGWLAKATGTVFINRDARDAQRQKDIFTTRLMDGHKLLFFPEGTSTDGLQVLPFKSTLFAAFFTEELRSLLSIQPVSVLYQAPKGADPRFYGWWGDMALAPHLLQVLAQWPQGHVEVVYHPPLKVSDFADRKALAKQCENAVRSGFTNPLNP